MPPNNGHSTLGASKAHRWMNCPGSVRLCANIEEPQSVYAAEGTAAHYLAETCLRKELDAAAYSDRVIRILKKGCSILKPGAVAQEGDFEIDEEMIEAVQIYLDAIRYDVMDTPGAELEIEKKFDLSKLRPGMYGTNDACLKQPFGILRVYDLKYGAGYAVEVTENPQLLYYALGAYLGGDYEEVELVVIQPRARHKEGSVRRWRFPAAYLDEWAEKELLPAAERTEDPKAPTIPGHWCKFCPAMGQCKGVLDFAIETTKGDFSATVELPSPDLLSEEDLSRVMASADILRTWLSSVFAFAEDKLRRGETVTGWKLVQKKTNRVWSDEKAVIQALFKFRDKIFERKLFSPAKMEKFVKENGIAVDIEKLTTKPEGGITIAPESDRRPAVEINPAADFTAVEDDLEF